jgi:ribosome biogenesis GTPase
MPFIEDVQISRLARVIGVDRGWYRVALAESESHWFAQVTGAFRHDAHAAADYPTVGDWVRLEASPQHVHDRLRIEHLYDRRGALERTAAGTTGEVQVLAANVDEILIVISCNQDFNERRLDRAMVIARASGGRSRVLLSKVDLVSAEQLGELTDRVQRRFPHVDVLPVSMHEPLSVRALAESLRSGETYLVLGSSGVGKSTLLNELLGREVQDTASVREDDDKGRHTTVGRSLHRLKGGALVIDTPGIREIALTGDAESLDESFAEIEELIGRCRFTNCAHGSEPGCAVRAALEEGELSEERYESYQKLRREVAFQRRRQSKALQSEARQKWKRLGADAKARKRFERGED